MDRDDTVASDTVPTLTGPTVEGTGGTPRYTFGELIGKGGMGEVLSARDAQIGRTVAIKRLRGANPEAVARFLREAQVQGRLEHPAVVPVHELSHDERGPFFVMKQLAGVTLADVITDPFVRAKFPRQQLLRALADICLAIEFAHTRGVVHRDLKPANIVLGEFGEVYVLDWGIARVVGGDDSWSGMDTTDDGTTQAGAILGTPGYMSPEQVSGEPVDGRTDVYALGCMLFEILALAPLHPRGTAGLASSVGGIDPAPRLAGEPPELVAACVAAVAERDARIPTARALGERITKFLDGDRDHALREDLARAALDEARAATDPRVAIAAASRALALSPASREPAELLGRLMLQPPEEAPPEVEEELRRIDLAAIDATRPLMIGTALSYVLGGLMLWLIGFHDNVFFIGGTAVCLGMVACGIWTTGRALVLAAVGGNLILLAWIAYLVSPFLIVPGLAVVLIMATVTHLRFVRMVTVVALSVVALLAPFVLGLLGVLPSTVDIHASSIELHTQATELSPVGTIVVMVSMMCMMFTSSGLIATSDARARRAAQRAVQIQKWQLDQLLPR